MHHAPCVQVFCDPVQTEHILANLLANAVAYSPPGTPVQLRLRVAGGQLACAISNTGSLHVEGGSERVFERYYRGDNSRGQPGVGIGLYMARSLARLQGGDLTLREPVGEQVTFVLTVPVADAAAPPPLVSGLEPSA